MNAIEYLLKEHQTPRKILIRYRIQQIWRKPNQEIIYRQDPDSHKLSWSEFSKGNIR